jgi:hypothetical protein
VRETRASGQAEGKAGTGLEILDLDLDGDRSYVFGGGVLLLIVLESGESDQVTPVGFHPSVGAVISAIAIPTGFTLKPPLRLYAVIIEDSCITGCFL